MRSIRTIEIEGFWGDRDCYIEMFPDVNFFIGQNGCGKTTILNIVAAALQVRTKNLLQLPFKKIKITFQDTKTRKIPSIFVEKRNDDKFPFEIIVYTIRNSASDKEGISFELIGESSNYFHLRHSEIFNMSEEKNNVSDCVQKIISSSWLSVQRSSSSIPHHRDERIYEYSVDRKLEEITNMLVRFFSEMEKRASDETKIFQQEIFLSLLHDATEKSMLGKFFKLDLENEEKSLTDIFKKFNLKSDDYINKTNEFYNYVTQVQKTKNSIDFLSVSRILNCMRVHYIVEKWNDLNEKHANIFKIRDVFLDTINNMYCLKNLKVNDKNEIFVISDKNEILNLSDLSSGEKQLLILLGEALLQRKENWVYIADEPELSLHVSWQEVLVENIRKINPQGQILIATHSPDIVGSFSSNIHKIENCFL